MNPDLTLSRSGRDMGAAFRALRFEGVGKLLMESERLDDGIAIHYSMPSVHAAGILGYHPRRRRRRSDDPGFPADRDGWVQGPRRPGPLRDVPRRRAGREAAPSTRRGSRSSSSRSPWPCRRRRPRHRGLRRRGGRRGGGRGGRPLRRARGLEERRPARSALRRGCACSGEADAQGGADEGAGSGDRGGKGLGLERRHAARPGTAGEERQSDGRARPRGRGRRARRGDTAASAAGSRST